MLVYLYDRETKEYIKTQKAQPNPKVEGEYLLPANSTTEQLPLYGEQQTVIFTDHWVVVPDFRGAFMVNADMIPDIVKEFGQLPEGYVLINQNQINDIETKGKNYFVIQNGELIRNPNYEKEEAEKREAEFKAEFFNTSLGYVRRRVTMQDGTTKDFLSDILPLLQVGIPVLTYTKELEQHKVIVTEQFINECKQQVLKDFYGESL